MQKFGCVLRINQLRNASNIGAKQMVGQLPAPQLEETFQLIGSTSVRDICKLGSSQALKLGQLINGLESGHDLRKVRNKLIRKFNLSYDAVNSSLKNAVTDPIIFEMSMYRKLGPKQYMAFTKALKATIESGELSIADKKERLYRIISLQHDLYPEAARTDGFIISDDVHRWFWDNLPRAESFDHFYFLIKNDIHLSSCFHVRKFTKRLMQGSEMELQLATFQLFLHDEAHRTTFHNKFIKLYRFESMIILVNKILNSKDFRFIKIYLAALLHKMELLKSPQSHLKSNRLLFVHFSNTLLYYLAQTGNTEMFLEAFTIQLRHMQRVGLLDDSKVASRLLQRSFNFVLKMLRQKGLQEEVFRLIGIIQKVCVDKDRNFNERIIVELMSSLRSFNDPKLTCQYVLSAFRNEKTAQLLNELGIWGAVFHQSPQLLPENVLNAETKAQDELLPNSLQIDQAPSHAVLTELYRVILFTNAKIMGPEEYQNFLLDLYKNYAEVLRLKKFKGVKHDTGILSVFLHNIRLELSNPKLAYEVLTNFYSHSFASNVRITSRICPFSLVTYKNSQISQAELSNLLSLMQSNGVTLHLRFCIAMILRFSELNNLVEARSWYDKILQARFEIKHKLLIKVIRDNGWEYPRNFDMSLLDEIDNTSTEVNDDTLYLEGSSEFEDSECYTGDSEKPLLEVIDLIGDLANKSLSRLI